jgi:excinuclease ABC subunit C
MLELDCGREFDAAHAEEFFAAVPPRAGVCRVEPRAELAGAQPYLLRTADLRRRLTRLLGPPDPAARRLNLRAFAARVRWRVTGSNFEQAFLLWQHLRELHPRQYRARMRLRPAALLKVNLRNEFPRCYVTRRVLADGGFYFGPFAGRKAAEAFAERFLDLFQVRRCQIKIRRDPDFPGCLYSEMKMCLAPCFAGCTKPDYDVEVGRVVNFLATGGASLEAECEREREAASERLEYERAAAVHRRLEKVSEVLRGWPEPARRIEELHAVILERAAEENAVAVFAVRGGIIAEPFLLRFDELASEPRSLDALLKAYLEPQGATQESRREEPGPGPDRAMLEDHLSLLARWYSAKPRSGELFFPAPPKGSAQGQPAPAGWPYRRMIRACSRLLAGPGSAEPPPASAE